MPFWVCFLSSLDQSMKNKFWGEEPSNEQFFYPAATPSWAFSGSHHPFTALCTPHPHIPHDSVPISSTSKRSFASYIFLILIKQIFILTLMVAIMILHYVRCELQHKNKLYKQFSSNRGASHCTLLINKMWVAAIRTFPPDVLIYWVTAASPFHGAGWRWSRACAGAEWGLRLRAERTRSMLEHISWEPRRPCAWRSPSPSASLSALKIISQTVNRNNTTCFAVWLLFIDTASQELKHSLGAA